MRRLAEVPVDPADARRRAAEILRRDEFAPPTRSVLDRVLEWIGRQLGRLFSTLGGGGGGAAVGWLLVTAALAGLVVLVVWGLRRSRGRIPSAPPAGVTVVVVARRSADAWRAEAAAHASAGRWREALRCRYRAVVAEMVDRDMIETVPGTTTGHERAQVARSLPDLATMFAGLSATFDRGVYGGEPVGPDDLAEADALDRAWTAAAALDRADRKAP